MKDFRPAVDQAVAEDGGPLLDAQRLEEILGVLPQVLTLHSNILAELEERIQHWYDAPQAFAKAPSVSFRGWGGSSFFF